MVINSSKRVGQKSNVVINVVIKFNVVIKLKSNVVINVVIKFNVVIKLKSNVVINVVSIIRVRKFRQSGC